MAGIVMPPMAEQVAVAEPEMAPNSAEATTVTTARLPFTHPNSALDTSTSFIVMLRDMMLPASMKKGIASMAVELMPAKVCWGMTIRGMPPRAMAASVAVPRARKMGTPQIERTSSPTIVTRPTLMPAPPSSYGPAPGTSPIPLK